MDNSEEHGERRLSNTEYVPTKCRVTKPPPPKPATNPLQFIKVSPCPLFQKAHEQIKKVEEIKKERKDIQDDIEDWQANLDNWKSSRRKRQEHIIERVVEVKKIEQEEHERNRKKSKTFSEMMEERNKGRHKITIPIYDDDPNDLSDYGIGSSSSRTNSIKDVDTDDSGSILDDKDQCFDSPLPKENMNNSNRSQSEDELNVTKKYETDVVFTSNNNYQDDIKFKSNEFIQKIEPKEQYTYEGAIEDYRSRIQTKINESIFAKDILKSKEFSEAQIALPKGEIFKRKEIFDKPLEISHYESNTTRRLSEDFMNTQSIKQRLQSLEKCTDQPLTSTEKNGVQTSLVKQRLQSFNGINKEDHQNINGNKNQPNKISNFLLQSSNNVDSMNKNDFNWKNREETSDRSSSPETELYMNKLNMFDKELDTMYGKSSGSDNGLEDCNYPPSTSSTELMGLSSDREDSGIHTADVSCSVSQADEPVEEELALITIPSCIEKLEKENELQNDLGVKKKEKVQVDKVTFLSTAQVSLTTDTPDRSPYFTKDEIIDSTLKFLESVRKNALENLDAHKNCTNSPKIVSAEIKHSENKNKDDYLIGENNENIAPLYSFGTTSKASKELNSEKSSFVPSLDFSTDLITDSLILDGHFPLSPSKVFEPPKVKPPPPPVPDIDNRETNVKRLDSTKRIKKELHLKRSSFLGLDESVNFEIDPDLGLDKPPDVDSFLQKESKLEKSLYKKTQDDRLGVLSKVESQDSGLDIDRGRLSSDTWCSSSNSTHDRQDSGQTNSITSEEDEITKKEREIIEMVEKEEKCRDDFQPKTKIVQESLTCGKKMCEPTLGSEKFDNPYFPDSSGYLDQDSEVLKVEQELRELEEEELKRKRDNLLFKESCAKARLKNSNNRRSLENICDEIYQPSYSNVEHRKSMPELQHIALEARTPIALLNPVSYSVYHESDVQYRKSMPDIQHAYQKSVNEYRKSAPPENDTTFCEVDHRKSMPELQHEAHRSAFKTPVNRQPILPAKPLRTLVTKEQKDRFMFVNPVQSDALHNGKTSRQLMRHNIQALSAAPRNRHLPNDNWIQVRQNPEAKNYNQHWVYQEAELRRLQDQQKHAHVSRTNRPQGSRQDKPLPDAVIHTLTQRVQNRASAAPLPPVRRTNESPGKDYSQHPYLGHALPVSYPPSLPIDASPDRMLSVSGKKKCSYCGNELGRGAAMIIESLCLFYHMECFKCCVCHMQLGDGLMGTDVRVRNQKLHCHNCYSSDDGIKFSCV